MAWIELHQELREHKKMFACAELLGVSRVIMVGTLVSLWLWALDNAQDGSLNGISNKTIARICDWPEKKAERLISALAQTGWLDYDGESYHIHDWFDYAGRLIEHREKEAKRKKNAREKAKTSRGTSAGCPQDVRGKSCATVPIPYLNRTVPDLCGGDGDARARTQQASESELARIGIRPGDYVFSIHVGLVSSVEAITAELMRTYCKRSSTPTDCRKVFDYISRWDPENGTHISTEAVGLLSYAFEQANLAGKLGDWRYISGIMDRLAARGITTVEAAIQYDEDHAEGG